MRAKEKAKNPNHHEQHCDYRRGEKEPRATIGDEQSKQHGTGARMTTGERRKQDRKSIV